MGTVSPVVAKLAVDRLKRYKRTGTAIGQVYAWGMVGSILGTFLTGFVLIDLIGTKGVLLLLGTVHGLRGHGAGIGLARGLGGRSARALRGRVHSAEHVPEDGRGVGHPRGKGRSATTEDGFAWIDESNYYFIKVDQRARARHGPAAPHPGSRQPDSRLLRARPSRAAGLRLRAHLRPGGLPGRQGRGKITLAPDSPPTTRQATARHGASLPDQVFAAESKDKAQRGSRLPKSSDKDKDQAKDQDQEDTLDQAEKEKTRTTTATRPCCPRSSDPRSRPCSWAAAPTPSSGTCSTPIRAPQVDVAEIDPAVTNANFKATGLPRDTTDQDLLGRRPPVRRAAPGQQAVRPDLRRRVQRLLGSLAPHHPRVQREDRQDDEPDRRLHDQHHRRLRVGRDRAQEGREDHRQTRRSRDAGRARSGSAAEELARAHRYGGFLGAWAKTAS